MSLGEFDLISRFFMRPEGQGPRRAQVGNGDDCAVIAPAPGHHIALSTDTLVEGRHFLSTVDPARLGHKSLAVNLSDLAAAGARPLGFTLALTLPRADAIWLEGFSKGLLALADAHDCELIGGDTTAGPLTIGITVLGEVPAGGALLRNGARPGHELWVSGQPGEARLGLEAFRGTLSLSTEDFQTTRDRMECPTPRVALGLALRGVASAAIDVSDGLLGDLGHILRRSGVGATLHTEQLPRSACLTRQPAALQLDMLLAGGDDYELLFTAPAEARSEVLHAAQQAGVAVHRFGRIDAEPGLRLLDQGQPLANRWTSFDHFRA